jgi:hypothetical protein
MMKRPSKNPRHRFVAVFVGAFAGVLLSVLIVGALHAANAQSITLMMRWGG